MTMRTMLTAALAATALSGCMTTLTPEQEASLGWDALHADVRRAYAYSYQEIPFENGAMSVVAHHHNRIETYRLVPCRNGTRICGGSAHGPAGRIASHDLDYTVVTGLYGVTFFLSPGGDGGLRRAGHADAWLSWNSVGDDVPSDP